MLWPTVAGANPCELEPAANGGPVPQRIYGTVVGMSPLCVNGFAVTAPAETRFLRDGRSSVRAHLGLGHVVRIETNGATPLVAKRIDLDFALAGPIEKVDVAGRRLTILRTEVHVRQDALIRSLDGSNQGLHALVRGEHIDVSGLRNPDGTIEASRLDVRPAGSPNHVTGIAMPVGRNTLYVERVRGTTADPMGFDPEQRGQRVQLRGKWNTSRQQLDEGFARVRPLVSHDTTALSLEAVATPGETGNEVAFTTTPFGVANGTSASLSFKKGTRLHVLATRDPSGRWLGRSFAVIEAGRGPETIEIVPFVPEAEDKDKDKDEDKDEASSESVFSEKTR